MPNASFECRARRARVAWNRSWGGDNASFHVFTYNALTPSSNSFVCYPNLTAHHKGLYALCSVDYTDSLRYPGHIAVCLSGCDLSAEKLLILFLVCLPGKGREERTVQSMIRSI